MSYVRVGILGASPGGEVWSINPTFDPTGEFGSTVDQTALDAATDAIAALNPAAGLLQYLSTTLTITGARVEVRDDASDNLLAISTQLRSTPLAGTGTVLRSPTTAIVFSLRTNTPGGSGRGRLYWPAVGGTVNTGMRFDNTQVLSALTDMRAYTNAIRGALAAAFPTIGFDLAVRSKTTHTTPHVNKMQAGNVPDTQRRRRDNLIEDYQFVGIPA